MPAGHDRKQPPGARGPGAPTAKAAGRGKEESTAALPEPASCLGTPPGAHGKRAQGERRGGKAGLARVPTAQLAALLDLLVDLAFADINGGGDHDGDGVHDGDGDVGHQALRDRHVPGGDQ